MVTAHAVANWNENNLNPLTMINWRASLVPAAAVIPAPVAYTNVAAVKKLVVGFLVDSWGPADQKAAYLSLSAILSWFWSNPGLRYIYFEKIRVFKASLRDEYISME